MTKLGLQLGIQNALLTASQAPATANSSARAAEIQKQKKAKEQEVEQAKLTKRKANHVAIVHNVGSELKKINSRLSDFDSLLSTSSQRPRKVARPIIASKSDLLRITSPQRTRHQASIFTNPHKGSQLPNGNKIYRIRVDFWNDEEITRMIPHTLSDDPCTYGHEPSYLILNVPDNSTPYDLIRCVLNAWGWTFDHSFRFTGSINSGTSARYSNENKDNDDSKLVNSVVFEGAAFTITDNNNIHCTKKTPFIPTFNYESFNMSIGSKCLLEYDLNGDAWKWECTCLDICTDLKNEAQKLLYNKNITTNHLENVGIQVLNRHGARPCQYLEQYLAKYRDLNMMNKMRKKEDIQCKNDKIKPRGKIEWTQTDCNWREIMGSRYRRKSENKLSINHNIHQYRLESSKHAKMSGLL